MVLFTIDTFKINTTNRIGFAERVLLDATIIPEKELSSSSAVMEIITKVANILKEKLYKTYGEPIKDPYTPKPYYTLYYFLDELGREKIYIGTYPENTHYLREYLEPLEERRNETLMDVFFDVGSPIRHIYLVTGSSNGYAITGIGCQHMERYDINVNILSPDRIKTPLTEEYEYEIKSNNIHIIPRHPKNMTPTIISNYLFNALSGASQSVSNNEKEKD